MHGTSSTQGRLSCAVASRFGFPSHESTALTYRDWLRQRLDRDMNGDFGYVRVQFMRRGVKGCGVVVDARMGEQSQDWFQVQENYSGTVGWLPGMKVRLCSGDGRCSCEDSADAPGGLRACAQAPGASTVPPGNTGTTVRGKA